MTAGLGSLLTPHGWTPEATVPRILFALLALGVAVFVLAVAVVWRLAIRSYSAVGA